MPVEPLPELAAEVPVALVFNGLSHAVMMATPHDLEDFALGFALSEGLLDTPADCRGIEVVDHGAAFEAQIEIASSCFARLKERRRTLAGRTGCGLCGIDSLQALELTPDPLTPPSWVAALDSAVLHRAFEALPSHQPLNARTGALHAAAWARPDGTLSDVREDVGRHNALDKLIGHLAHQRRLGEDGFVVLSSRASYELVLKCARLHIAALATLGSPTLLAAQIAQQAQVQLWGQGRHLDARRYA